MGIPTPDVVVPPSGVAGFTKRWSSLVELPNKVPPVISEYVALDCEKV
jgi:hypothetical protein